MTTENQYNIKVLYKNDEKLCSKCKNYYPLTFYHSNGYDDKGNLKLRGECKSCRKVSNRKNYLKRRKTKKFIEDLYVSIDKQDEEKLKKILEDDNNCDLLLKIINQIENLEKDKLKPFNTS